MSFKRIKRGNVLLVGRENANVFIKAIIPNPYEENQEKWIWMFHILCYGSLHAANIETRINAGEETHFGVDNRIKGIIAIHGNFVGAIGADEKLIQNYIPADEKLEYYGNPRDKHRIYYFRSKKDFSEAV